MKVDNPFTIKHIPCKNAPNGISFAKYQDIITKMNLASRCNIYIKVHEKVYKETEINDNNNQYLIASCNYYDVQIQHDETRSWDELLKDLHVDYLTD
jgi:hypothetical protein